MQQSYWDLSSIVCESYKLPCHFKIDAPGLSHLTGVVPSDPSPSASSSGKGDDDDGSMIRMGSRLELPFWLAEYLTLHDIIDISLPRPYAARVRNALNADARSVQLRGLAGWWYAVGARLGGLAESDELKELLSKTYTLRLPPLFSAAQHLASAGRSASSRGQPSGSSGGTSSASAAAGGGEGEGEGAIDPDAPGFGSAAGTGMGEEMVGFLKGCEEGERELLAIGQEAARIMRLYLAGR